jgi:hypothetical protein
LRAALDDGRFATLVFDGEQYVGAASVYEHLAQLMSNDNDNDGDDDERDDRRALTAMRLVELAACNVAGTPLLDATASLSDALRLLDSPLSSLAVACPSADKARARVQRPVAIVTHVSLCFFDWCTRTHCLCTDRLWRFVASSVECSGAEQRRRMAAEEHALI